MNELVSVIVPVYNCEQTLRQCVDSLLAQSYQNLELLLLDDGSRDKSAQICDQYQYMDKRVHSFHKKNQGVSATRNLGIQRARGTYLVFVDGDDFVHEDFLRELLDAYQENTIPICGHWEHLKPSGKKICMEMNGFPKSKELSVLYPLLYEQALINSLWDKLYLTSIIREYQISFDESLSLGEDLLFNLQYLGHVKFVNLIDKPLYHYIRHENGSLRSKYYEQMDKIQLHLYQNILAFAKENCSLQLPEIYPVYRRWVADCMNAYIYVWERENKRGKREKYHYIREEMKHNRCLQEVVEEMRSNHCISLFRYLLIHHRLFFLYYASKLIYQKQKKN